jgi:hypothetical protein
MIQEFVLSLKGSFRLLLASLLVAAAAAAPGQAGAEEVTPTEEVVQELTELTVKLTPFKLRYDGARKILAFTEELEGGDKSRTGELQAHLDRMDASRIPWEPSDNGFQVLIGGRPLAGRVVFFCRQGQRCIRRGFRDATTPALVGEETGEELFRIDIVGENQKFADLIRFGRLVQHLVTISDPGYQPPKSP